MKAIQTSSNNQPANLSAGTKLCQLSLPTQSAWIERLFSRLLTIYGARFERMWLHVDKDELKRTWAEALGNYDAETISKALQACLNEVDPPNLPQFLNLCRQSYQPAPKVQLDFRPMSDEECRKRISEIKQRFKIVKGAESDCM